jgi:hypothetical protein
MSPTFYKCFSCGADLAHDQTCEAVFNEFLALEFSDANYGQVHFLTVACYMIQHNKYSEDALVWIKERLREFLEKGIPIETIRQQAKMETDQSKRSWRVTSKRTDRIRIHWSMTIMDVAAQYHDAESYCRLIRQWAEKTLADMP